jgi:hypothetical protein
LSLTDLKEKVGTGLRVVHATNKTELTRWPCNILPLVWRFRVAIASLLARPW